MEYREDVRKWLHLAAGLAPAPAVLLLGWGGAVTLALFFFVYLAVAADWARRGVRLPVVAGLVRATSRRTASSISDALAFLLAIVLVGLAFPLPYAMGAFAVLGVGDTVASVAGRAWGRRRLPWNESKTWAGLVVGSLAATVAFLAFTIVGGTMQGAGLGRLEPLGPTWRSALLLFVLLPGFPLVHLAAWLAVRAGAPRRAKYRPSHLWSTYGVALACAASFLFVAPLFLTGPLLPSWHGHGRFPWVVLAAPVLGMIAESAARRADNVWTALVTAASAYSLFALQRILG